MKDVANYIENMSEAEFNYWEEAAERKERPEMFEDANHERPPMTQIEQLRQAAETYKEWRQVYDRRDKTSYERDIEAGLYEKFKIARDALDFPSLLAERATLAAEVERFREQDRRALLLGEKLLQVARALGLNDVPVASLLEGDEVVQRASAMADENKRFNGALDALGKLGRKFQSALAPAAKEG
jgi:hypothetical protein